MNSPLAGNFTDHLKELRHRVTVSFLSILIFSLTVYIFADRISAFFMMPLFKAYPALANLVYTNLSEAFVSYMKMSFLVGLILSFPVICYQVWMYVSPGLHSHERRVALKVVASATILFAAGIIFSFFIVLPEALSFLMGFAGEEL
ncbi:MAG: twin-arginine translocase subunit TatC, partial [Desulfobulbaceae bacterium]|nr:twin-arginine translocase subunit TatC [Desulfobulbaceae bacterium]